MSTGSTPNTIADFEHACRQAMDPAMFEFLFGEHGNPNWSTYTSNRASFNAVKLRPRVLTGVADPHLSTSLLGRRLSFPVIVGPTGGLPGNAGELAQARAARTAGTVLVLSSVATTPAEEVAAAADGHWWQQVFLYRDRSVTEWQVRNAIELGAGAIVLTVSNTGDTDYRHKAVPVPYTGPDPEVTRRFVDALGAGALEFDPAVAWADVDWLRSLTQLPLVVKGIQTAEDAALCLEHGVDGVVVSNHGGRFAQGVRGTMEALPEIVEAISGRIDVSVDGGVRQGQDVLKALAIGAKTVWIGRAAYWGQAVDGEAGTERVLELLRSELRSMMALCGVGDVNSVDPALVTRESIPTLEG